MTQIRVPAEAADELDRWLGGSSWSADPIAGDASTRRYFRVRCKDGSTAILTLYPPDARESLDRFLRVHDALRSHVSIPEVLQRGESVVLQEDVGDQSLSGLLEQDPHEAADRYREASRALRSLASAEGPCAGINPAFDRAKFVEELDMARKYYVEQLAGKRSEDLIEPLGRLAARLTKHPYMLCHRDYHGQNIYVFNDRLYLIDYQDTRMGPDSYDLASLLRDRGVWRTLGAELESELMSERAAVLGESLDSFRVRYFEALLQRSIKAIGTFARLVVVNGRRQYLAYIDPTLETVRECARELDEWQDLPTIFPFEFKTP